MERRDPAVRDSFDDKGGKGGMMKTPIRLQDLRRRIYVKAKAETSWRFWGLFVHVWTMRSEDVFLSPSYGGDARREYEQFASLGVDGFFTDFPDVAAAIFKRH